MKKIFISGFTAVLLLSAAGCQTDFDTDVSSIPVTSGSADFTKYVALGNSLTSGYRDGALYIDGQNESYPNMLAAQMRLAGGAQIFRQPMMTDNWGGIPMAGIADKYILVNKDGKPFPVQSPTIQGKTTLASIYTPEGFQNMGVPGAKSFHLVAPGYGSMANLAVGAANPYFVRFASSAGTSVLQDAMAQNPTFYSLWIGNNDVLSYATNGGMNSQTVGGVTTWVPATVQTGNTNPATYKSNDISDPAVVAGSIKAVLDGMKSKGAVKGVIANIPNVTTIPFFTRIPYNAINLDATAAQKLNNSLYGPLKQALTALGQGSRINLATAGNNAALIIDNSLANLSAQLTYALTQGGVPAAQAAYLGNVFGRARHAKEGDLILLKANGVLGLDAQTMQAPTATSQFIYGPSFPLPDQLTLTVTEVGNITTAVTAYNSAIQSMANSYGLAHVDANSKMKELGGNSGIMYDGVKYTATFVTGGSFSLDGVHLNGRGYAVIANEFIKAINAKYGSTLPQVSPGSYTGVIFP